MDESIGDAAVPWEIEAGESFDIADDGFCNISAVEQHFIEKCHRQHLHVFANARHERQAVPEQFLREFFADVFFIPEYLAGEVAGKLGQYAGIAYIAARHFDGDDFAQVIEDNMQLESKEPAHTGLAPGRQSGKYFVPRNAFIVAHRQ